MTFSAGERLGPYEILAPLGEGGMGQVWKARDTRLNRTVAIKTSLKNFSDRFEREAKAIAALNHPHICSLYDVGPNYLVMEYVEGKTLAGPVPIDEALKVANQILDALDAAHRKGITHRDLKPGNILLGPNGVKVLDFGLAKISAVGASASGDTATMTMAMPLTSEGTILGTMQYMAPEQLEGREADARSDIFSFGVILYELIAGKRPFSGGSQASLIASVLKESPAVLQGSESFNRVVATCLEKDPEKRWQSAKEVKHALEWAASTKAVAAAPEKKKSMVVPIAAAVALTLAVVGTAAWRVWPAAPAAPAVIRFQLEKPAGAGVYPTISPDGRKIVILSKDGIWLHNLDAIGWSLIPSTAGAVTVFWSPNSDNLAFSTGRQLRKVDLMGGPSQVLTEVDFQVGTGAWSPNGTIVFPTRGSAAPLYKVTQAGGQAQVVTQKTESETQAFPVFLPDGHHFLYLRLGAKELTGIYVGDVDVKPSEQSKERLISTRTGPAYSAGYVFYLREHTLMAQTLDEKTMKVTGEPILVADNVASLNAGGLFTISSNGNLVYGSGGSGDSQVIWVDRQGKRIGEMEIAASRLPQLSPDEHSVVVRDTSTAQDGDLWIHDLQHEIHTRFTFAHAPGSGGVWSRDGKTIAFSGGNRSDTILSKPFSGTAEPAVLLKGRNMMPTSWSADGKFLLFQTAGQNDIGVLPLEGDRKPVLLLGTSFGEANAQFSPDGRWIAYRSDESGRDEIYVRAFLPKGPKGEPALGDGKWQVSRDGGQSPRWTSGGKEIIFADGTRNNLLATDVSMTEGTFSSGTPHLLFRIPDVALGWDVTGDGKRFLIATPLGSSQEATQINVVVNAMSRFKKN